VELEKEDFGAARSTLERAIAADAESWLPHGLLADAYLKQHNYEKASDEAQIALRKEKKGASAAQLVLGQALINLGRDREGIEALQEFLHDSPGSPTALQVRNLIDEVVRRPAVRSTTENPSGIAASVSGVEPLLAVAQPTLVMKAWKPPGIDELKPSLAAGVMCPYEKVINESGDRVKQLVDNVARFAAIEDLLHQRLDEFGNPTRSENRKFNYVASISEPQAGVLLVDEYRADRMSLAGYPDQIASTGLAVLALVFHPHMRDNFEMKCEGLGDWRGQASWLVRFQQRDDKPANIHGYKVGNELYTVKLKGRAWITADNFQIVRIESELVTPLPEIKLLAEHQIVEYGPVPFLKRNTELWLPKSAEMYFDFRKHRFYRRHSFDHYMLFSVDADEKPNKRKAKANPAHDAPPH
jgi:tetratricopeptide (TPR) repeat protein